MKLRGVALHDGGRPHVLTWWGRTGGASGLACQSACLACQWNCSPSELVKVAAVEAVSG
ncbi:hypothetical protein [Paenibacillus plantiphilus]|uniref:hypothetical protein n=1 Tax=Paenibacillus plantiphilus TaxID=2905650 RepID=UPI001F32C1C0|nr:hypothetical protein [Paenibacillus plantiphilus]